MPKLFLMMVMQGSLGQNTTSIVPPAVQVRTLRKGSTDHLSINIDGESERLISSQGTDEDKGLPRSLSYRMGKFNRLGKLMSFCSSQVIYSRL